jgi:hypothetical protein
LYLYWHCHSQQVSLALKTLLKKRLLQLNKRLLRIKLLLIRHKWRRLLKVKPLLPMALLKLHLLKVKLLRLKLNN